MHRTNRWPFACGVRVLVTKDIDLQPYATVRTGETGVVVFADDHETNIRMDVVHRGLRDWDNCIWIIPELETDDVLMSLQSIREDQWIVSQLGRSSYSLLRSVVVLLS